MSDMPKTEAEAAGRRRMQIFRAEGEKLTDEHMPMEGIDESMMAGFARMMETGAAASDAEDVRCLFREPGEDGLSLCYAWFKSNFVLPRHSHNADCIYYVVGGDLKMGSAVLRKGDGVFVPAGHAYTYQAGPDGVEVLEFRNATRFNILFKDNDTAHWDRMVGAYRDNLPKWRQEKVPPSAR